MNTRRWFAGALLATLLVGSACSSSDDNDSSPQAQGGTEAGGLPETAPPDQVVALTTEALKGKRVRLALITGGIPLTDEWTNSMAAGFTQAGIDFKSSNAGFDPQVLAQNVETYINEKPDVLIVHNADLSGTAQLLKRAQDEGIYVIVINLASNAQTDAYVGPDWTTMSAMLANRAADDCVAKSKKKMAIITGFGADSGSVLSGTAMEKVFKDRGLEVVSNQPGQFDPNKAREIAGTILQQHPDLCAFIGSWDGMMIGAAAAVEQAGKAGTVGVYTTDSSKPTCEAIAKGSMTAALNYSVPDMGPQMVAVAKYLLQSGVKPGSGKTALFSRMSIIDKTNSSDPEACYDGKVV
ncbi:MAG TPA: sugar ABC transporter substrate-binding protein [Acidimicrobiia bacterium]|nr:sugar ABC transporter substrate-binding protein [Acidimicrobiia bacterium]